MYIFLALVHVSLAISNALFNFWCVTTKGSTHELNRQPPSPLEKYPAIDVAAITYIIYCAELAIPCEGLPASAAVWLDKKEVISKVRETPVLIRLMRI